MAGEATGGGVAEGRVGPPTPLAVIAGRGALPRRIAERRAAAGLPYLLVVFQGSFEPWMAGHPHQRHEFERVGRLFRALRAEGVTHIVFAGAMSRPRLRPWRADLKALTILLRAAALLRRGDDAMLRGFAAVFEREGIAMLGAAEVLGDAALVGKGALGARGPAPRERLDAALAARIVAATGALDVGQGAVVAHGLCLAVEAIEGTDLMLSRIATLPAEKRAAAPPPAGVLYKGPKPGQDRRLDLPTIGPDTVTGAAAAGLRGIVVAAGETVLLDGPAVRAAADAAGLFVYGATAAELAAWAEA